LRLAGSLGRDDRIARILWTFWVYHVNTGHIREGLGWAERLIAEGTRLQSEEMVLAGHSAAACACTFLGELHEVLRHADCVTGQYDAKRHANVADTLTFDPLTTALLFRARAEWRLGFPDRAASSADAAVALARAVGHAHNPCFALLVSATAYFYGGDPGVIAVKADELERVARDLGFPFYADVHVRGLRARCMLLRGLPEESEAGFRAMQADYERLGQGLGVPLLLAARASAAVLASRPGDAIQLIDTALAQIDRPGWEERAELSELLRIRDAALVLTRDVAGAERDYRASLGVAREQQAKFLELRTATSYAALLEERGRKREALELLEPIHRWFTEGRATTADCRKAAALLEELRQAG
jgi:tetratricopeptide (TPR) repeat protein